MSTPPLSRHERSALERMAHHECRHDPDFVERLRSWSDTPPAAGAPSGTPGTEPRDVAAHTDASPSERGVARAGVLLVVAILIGLAVSGYAVFAAAIAVIVVMLPLVLRAHR